MHWTLAKTATAMPNESAVSGAAGGHTTATASLPPHGSAEQDRAQGRHAEPALHGHIIPLTGQEEKTIFISALLL